MAPERKDNSIIKESFNGDWKLFREVVNNRNVYYIYDADGILVYSAEKVFSNFENKHGIKVSPRDIDGWTYLTNVAHSYGLDEDSIKSAEDDWYNSDVLESSKRYLYSRPLVNLTIGLVGAERNFILTSREPNLAEGTYRWFGKHFPELPEENILIRDQNSGLSGTRFKVKNVGEFAAKADWVVFIDDSLKYIKAVVDANIPNCLAINVPQGIVRPDFIHDRLITIGRYPEEIQGMYPAYQAFKKALQEGVPY